MDRGTDYESLRVEIAQLLREREQQRAAGATFAAQNAMSLQLSDALERLNAMIEQRPIGGPRSQKPRYL